MTQEGWYLVGQEGGLTASVSTRDACSLSRAWEAAGKLRRAKIHLGSGQTCPAVRLNFNIVILSGREEAVLEGLDSAPPAHTKHK